MSELDIALLMRQLRMLAEQSGETVSPSRIDFMVSKLRELDLPSVTRALDRLLESARRFPTIAEIKSAAGLSEISDEDKAREVADRIWATIERFGSQRFDVKEVLGELGFVVVQRQGGWKVICDSATYANKTAMIAQWRESAAGILRKARTPGGLDELPRITDSHAEIKKLAEKHGV